MPPGPRYAPPDALVAPRYAGVLDPSFAPGTGTPEAGGLTTREALGYVRALRGLRFAGTDPVEVVPPYDGPGQPTAVAADHVAFELLALDAIAHANGER